MSNIFSVINELLCSEIQLRFYYHSGDYIAVKDLYSILSKCTSTPDLMLRKLLELGIIAPAEKPDVVVLK